MSGGEAGQGYSFTEKVTLVVNIEIRKICPFAEGTAGRRNSVHKGTQQCYRTAVTLRAPSAACVFFWLIGQRRWQEGAQGCHRGRGGRNPTKETVFIFFGGNISFSNVSPCLLAHPLSGRRLACGQEGRESWYRGAFPGATPSHCPGDLRLLLLRIPAPCHPKLCFSSTLPAANCTCWDPRSLLPAATETYDLPRSLSLATDSLPVVDCAQQPCRHLLRAP